MFKRHLLGLVALTSLLSVYISTNLWADEREFKVLTFNVWMVEAPYLGLDLADDMDERLKIIPEFIEKTGADIVALQEVWRGHIREELIRKLREHGYTNFVYRADLGNRDRVLIKRQYPNNGDLKYFSDFIINTKEHMGNGLLIASKSDFLMDDNKRTRELAFRKHTRFDESIIMKGGIGTRIYIPQLGWTNFYNSHLGAVTFNEDLQEQEPAHVKVRKSQAEELSWLVRAGRSWPDKVKNDELEQTGIALLAVDLNTHYNVFKKGAYTDEVSFEYALMTGNASRAQLGYIDTFRSIHPDTSSPVWTFDKDNPYVSSGYFGGAPSETIDYIFMSPNNRLKIANSELVFTEDIDDQTKARFDIESAKKLSDHYGILTTFSILKKEKE